MLRGKTLSDERRVWSERMMSSTDVDRFILAWYGEEKMAQEAHIRNGGSLYFYERCRFFMFIRVATARRHSAIPRGIVRLLKFTAKDICSFLFAFSFTIRHYMVFRSLAISFVYYIYISWRLVDIANIEVFNSLQWKFLSNIKKRVCVLNVVFA